MRTWLSVLSTAVIGLAVTSSSQQVRTQVITLERTTCFGTCPSYKISIYADGAVVYEGRRFVRVAGIKRYRISLDAVSQLIRRFEDSDYFSLKDEYTSIKRPGGEIITVTDLPTTYSSFTHGGRTKRIENYVGSPPKLRELENEVDRIAETRRYVRIDGTTVRTKIQRGWDIRGPEALALLQNAVQAGDADAVRAFMENGADPNHLTNGMPYLLMARGAEVIKALIDGGASVHVKSPSGSTPLHSAAVLGDVDSVKALIAAGANVNAADDTGGTALMTAASQGASELCRTLLLAGASANLKDKNGQNALDHMRAGFRSQNDSAKFFGEPPDRSAYDQTREVLLSAGTEDTSGKQ